MNNNTNNPLDIAVIGMACKVPGANNIMDFWKNIKNGVESVRTLTDEEIMDTGVNKSLLNDPYYVKKAAFLDDIDKFDAPFFDITPFEAEILDPQRRIFLECSWEALEDAGIVPQNYNGDIGVYSSIGYNLYGINNVFMNPEVMEKTGFVQFLINSDKDYVSTHLSYKLNLTGPSMNIQTACSSSLVAIHMAKQALLYDECDIAIAGGSAIDFPQNGYLYTEGSILSPDGHCRVFDNKSEGTIFGSGCGIVVLKKLVNAIKDRDNIRAVIKGSAINNDGAAKIGFTAPSINGQSEVIVAALANADCDAGSIGYIETHGTGTNLGDPVEIESLTQAFRDETDKKQFCAIGSVKPNVGHLNSAAGVTSFIKTVLVLENDMIPPLTNFESPNQKIDFENSPFYINKTLTKWKSPSGILRAGVSSLGVGGTNAHIILENYRDNQIARSPDTGNTLYAIPISGRSESVVKNMLAKLKKFLENNRDINIADCAYSLQTGRYSFPKRAVVTGRSINEIIKNIQNNSIFYKPELPGEHLKNVQSGFNLVEQHPDKNYNRGSTNVEQHPDKNYNRGSTNVEQHPDKNYNRGSTNVEQGMQIKIAQKWLTGEDVKWEDLYTDKQVKHISLPTYPFKHKRYWIDRIEFHKNDNESSVLKKISSLEDMFYIPSWVHAPLPYKEIVKKKNSHYKILFLDTTGLVEKLAESLPDQEDIIYIKEGSTYSFNENNKFTIQRNNKNDYIQLFNHLEEQEINFDSVVWGWGLTEITDEIEYDVYNEIFNRMQDIIYYPFLYLIQVLGLGNANRRINIFTLTNNAYDITGYENSIPGKTTISPICKTAQQEYMNLTCHLIDFDFTQNKPIDFYVCYVIKEISTKNRDVIIAYRNNQRWLQTYQPVKVFEKGTKNSAEIEESDVVLVTGGLVALTYLLSEYLALEKKVKICFLEEPDFPAEEQWDNWVEEKGSLDEISRQIKAFRALKEKDVQIIFRTIDPYNLEQNQKMIKEVEVQLGTITVALHCFGGYPNKKLYSLQTTDKTECNISFNSIIHTFFMMEAILKNHILKHKIILSGLSSFLAGVGFGSYAASSNFLINYVKKINKNNNVPWCIQSWGAVDIVWDYNKEHMGIIRDRLLSIALTSEEAVRAFKRIIQHGNIEAIAICPTDIIEGYNRWVKRTGLLENETIKKKNTIPRPELDVPYAEPENELEYKIAEVWQNILSIEKIGRNDNFFKLGGHSLIAIKLIDSIRKIINVNYTSSIIWEKQTIKELAEGIVESNNN